MNPEPQPNAAPIGPLQLRVMHVIWRRGTVTVFDVASDLNAEPGVRRLAYTTFLTVMRNLVRRGLLDQQKLGLGKAHRFSARVGEHDYKRAVISQIVADYCGGDRERLLRYLDGRE